MSVRFRLTGILLAALLVLTAAGCAAGIKTYVNSQAELGGYKKVGFLPFQNLSNERFASDRVARTFEMELLMTERYQVVGAQEFARGLRGGGVDPGNLTADPNKLKAATEALGVQGIILGTVKEYQLARMGQDNVPVVSFDVEMLDAPTGIVVWRTSVSIQGRSRVPVVGGVGKRTFTSLTDEACAAAVANLRRRAF